MPNVKQHRDNISGALTDRDNARDDLFQQLMEMEPQERAKLSPSLFARLTPEQLLTLVGGKLSETAIISSPEPEIPQAIKKSRFYHRLDQRAKAASLWPPWRVPL